MLSRSPRRLLSHAVGATLIAALAVTAFAVPASAATSASGAEALIIGWVNTDRAAAGLVPLRGDSNLAYIAGVRASRMASANTMSHTVGGNLSGQLSTRGVQWYAYGETIAWSTARWTVDAARAIYRSWMGSAPHRALLLEQPVQLHRCRPGASLVQQPDVRLGGHDRVSRSHACRGPHDRGGTLRR